jgi:hypothetical protein
MDQYRNFAYSTVATAPVPAAVGLTLDVAAGEGAYFPAPPFTAPVRPAATLPLISNATLIRVTGIIGDQLTFTRLAEGAANRAILVGDQIAATITAKVLNTDVQPAGVKLTAIEALASALGWLHNNGAGVFVYSTPSKADVGLGSVLDVAQEPALGNPGGDGYVLSSTVLGVRSWVVNGPSATQVAARIAARF